MPTPIRILCVEDSRDDVDLVLYELRKAGFEVACRRVQTPAQFLEQLEQPCDVILADFNLPQFDAPRALALLQQSGKDIPFIVVSGSIGEEVAVEIMRLPALAERGPRPSQGGLSQTPIGRESILLVEDDPNVRQLALVALQSYGYNVVEVTNGPEALRLVQMEPSRFQLLLSDVVMPDLSGRQLVEAIRPICPALKVLFMSGYTDDAVFRHGLLASGNPFLQKPFSPLTLARKVREVLDA